MTKIKYPNIVRGGVAIPLPNKTNYYLMRGRKHEQGGIDIGKNPRTGLEVEDGEVAQVTDKDIKIYSAQPILAGMSPSQLVMGGANPKKVFAAQERFKKVNGIKDDGTKATFGILKKLFGKKNKPDKIDFTGLKTWDGRGYNSDYISYIYDSLSKSKLNKNQQAALLASIINESGGDPFAVNKNTGKDYGLLQWVDRYQKTDETDPYKEIDNQLNYIYSTINNLEDQVSWTHGGKGSGYKSLKDAYADFNSDDLDTVLKGLTLGHVRPAGKHESVKNRTDLTHQIYDRIKRFGGNKLYTTKLNPKEEFEFRQWYKKLADKKGLNPDYDAEDHYYDYRGFWKNEDRDAILNDSPNAHFSDKYKKPGHPTFSNESIYSKGNTIGGDWVQDKNGNWLFNHSEYTKRYKNRTKDYLKGSGEGYIIDGDTIIDKKRFGGNMKHKLITLNIGGNSKLIRVRKPSSTGESERSEDIIRRQAKVGTRTGTEEELIGEEITLADGTKVKKYGNVKPVFNGIKPYIPTLTGDEIVTKERIEIPGRTKDKVLTTSDIIGLGSNLIGATATHALNRRTLNKMKYAPTPANIPHVKLKTKININPQIQAMTNAIADYERLTRGNTASSRTALARIRNAKTSIIDKMNEVYAQKENKESDLLNRDRMLQSQISSRNIAQYNDWREKKAAFDNAIIDKKGEENIDWINHVNQGVQDALTRRERRDEFNKTLMAGMLANPNLPIEKFSLLGIIPESIAQKYRLGYPLKKKE